MLEGFCCENARAVRDGSFISGMMISRDLLWDHPDGTIRSNSLSILPDSKRVAGRCRLWGGAVHGAGRRGGPDGLLLPLRELSAGPRCAAVPSVLCLARRSVFHCLSPSFTALLPPFHRPFAVLPTAFAITAGSQHAKAHKFRHFCGECGSKIYNVLPANKSAAASAAAPCQRNRRARSLLPQSARLTPPALIALRPVVW